MIKRHIAEPLLAVLRSAPVVLLHGARQTGKSTLVKWLAEHGHKPYGDSLVVAHYDSCGTLARIIARMPPLWPLA